MYKGGNLYNKYESDNYVVNLLMQNFLKALGELIRPLPILKVLEVGCGEGYLTRYIKDFKKAAIQGLDLYPEVISLAKNLHRDINFGVASVYQLPYPDNSFDLVTACEVLEHLEHPLAGLDECLRVSRSYCLFSVPHEPLWRIGNVLRGKYLSTLGNPPIHIQNWTKKQFVELTGAKINIIETKLPIPWIMVLGRKPRVGDNQ